MIQDYYLFEIEFEDSDKSCWMESVFVLSETDSAAEAEKRFTEKHKVSAARIKNIHKHGKI